MTVCPTPDMRPLTEYPRTTQTPVTEGSDDLFATATALSEDGLLQDPRTFEDGDLPSRIDWKRFAATRELLTRDFSAQITAMWCCKLLQTWRKRRHYLIYVAGCWFVPIIRKMPL